MMIEAAAESTQLKGIVSEGASSRSVRDELANPGGGWQELIGNGVVTVATAIFSNNLPPATLKSLVPKIAPGSVFFVYGERGQSPERPANQAFYAAAGPRGPSGKFPVRDTSVGSNAPTEGVRAARHRLLQPSSTDGAVNVPVSPSLS